MNTDLIRSVAGEELERYESLEDSRSYESRKYDAVNWMRERVAVRDRIIAKLAAAVEELRHALEAEAAWHDAEDENPKTTTFEERMDLCHYSEWACKKALGRDVPDEYEGIPRIIDWRRLAAATKRRRDA